MRITAKSRFAVPAFLLTVIFLFGFAGFVSKAYADDAYVATSLEVQASGDSGSVYRLYNANNGDHHYTMSINERDTLEGFGWIYEGAAWDSPDSSSIPAYRLYNPNSGDHHYTTDSNERDVLAGIGWIYEGISWYSEDSSGAPLYRLYNKWLTAGTHHYTSSTNERDELEKLGWVYEGIAWYGVSGSAVNLPSGEPIMGSSKTTVGQMVRRFNAVGRPYPSKVYAKYGAANIEQFCQILYEEASAEGVRAEVVFAQSMHETGWLQFGGDVSAEQCNFAGIGATGGVPGNSFNDWGTDSVRKGLRAQVQHLKAYASTDSCVHAIVDPRFTYVKRGCATTVQALGGKWATSSSYGTALVNQIQALLKA